MFSSVMRAQLSCMGHWSAVGLYAGVELRFYRHVFHRCGIFAISPALIAFVLPSVARVEQTADKPITQVSGWQDKNVRMLFIASTLMWTCNTMYIIDMPLWISSDLVCRISSRDLNGDGRRAGNSGDDSGGILRQTSRETPDDADSRSGRSAFLPG